MIVDYQAIVLKRLKRLNKLKCNAYQIKEIKFETFAKILNFNFMKFFICIL